MMHINDLQEKTASRIAGLRLQSDKFHDRIARAAALLVKKEQGNLRYGGQYADGSTLWLDTSGRGCVVQHWEPFTYESQLPLFEECVP